MLISFTHNAQHEASLICSFISAFCLWSISFFSRLVSRSHGHTDVQTCRQPDAAQAHRVSFRQSHKRHAHPSPHLSLSLSLSLSLTHTHTHTHASTHTHSLTHTHPHPHPHPHPHTHTHTQTHTHTHTHLTVPSWGWAIIPSRLCDFVSVTCFAAAFGSLLLCRYLFLTPNGTSTYFSNANKKRFKY